MKHLIKKHHKIGIAIILIAIVSFIFSFFFPTLSSYFVVIGIALLLVGLFVFDPSWVLY